MVDEMTVPVTTGIPLVVTTNVPDPLKGIVIHLLLKKRGQNKLKKTKEKEM
tara:strand:- start:84 stop:236 length:153 start_codon:yes stop_codon:yes gene_type:complete